MTLRIAIIAVIAFLPLQVDGQSPDPSSLSKYLSRGWTVLELGFWHDGGDYISNGPYALIQKLPDKKFLISKRPRSNTRVRLPIPQRYATSEEVSGWLERLEAIYEAAKEESEILESRESATIVDSERTEATIEMVISLGGERGGGKLGAKLDPDKRTMHDFDDLLAEILGEEQK